MLVFDAHLDLAYNALSLGRDLTQSVAAGRERGIEQSDLWRMNAGTLTTTLAEIAAHPPAIICGTIFVLPADAATTLEGIAYTTPEEARAQAWTQRDWYAAQVAAGQLHLITTQADLHATVTTPAATPGLILLMEGADGLLTPAELAQWFEAGLRWLGPAWHATRYCGGTSQPGPLTALGRELIGEMDRLGLALDASHLADESFWEMTRTFRGRLAASHSNCRRFVPGDRQLSDEMIKAIIERDGVIGIVGYNAMLVDAWDGSKESVTMDDVLRHIEHICTLAGDTLHVGIGSDFDGGFGYEAIPTPLNTWGDLRLIGAALQAAGWASADIANVLGGNWQRWFAQSLP